MGNNEWQGKLRSGMEEYSEPVPASVWNAVSAGVSAAWDRQRRVRRRRRMAAGASLFAAAAIAAAVVLPGLSGGSAGRADSGRLLAVASVPELQEGLFLIPDAAPLAGMYRTSGVPVGNPSVPAAEVARPVTDVTYREDPVVTDAEPATGGRSDVTEGSERDNRHYADEEPADPFPLLAEETPSGKNRGSRITLGLRASNLASMSSQTGGYGGMYGSTVAPALSAERDQVNSYSSVLLGNNSREVSTHTRHWQPVSVGVAASLRVSDFLSVESGLNYSCLVADMSSGTDENRYDIRQTLHYIGIPLRLRAPLWRPGNFEVYLSAGGEVEKCVYGTSSTTYIVNSSESSRAVSRVRDNKLQWSAGASVGLGYRFNEYLGIYVEPGVTWYFGNGGHVENVYRERPLNFSLALGLRFYLN